ncbi:hypothetical protein OF001_U260060 [Pseudomonas sp. OF001]|nr:hypothetical protein OF001_U260060 [Pseudomonas sp. OF001]
MRPRPRRRAGTTGDAQAVAGRAADAAARAPPGGAAGLAAGPGLRGQGRRHPPGVRRPRPAGARRARLPPADGGRARRGLPRTLPALPAGAGRGRAVQPQPLRGRGLRPVRRLHRRRGHSRPAGAAGRLRGRTGRARHPPAQGLSADLPRRAEGAPAQAPARPAQALEGRRRGPRGAPPVRSARGALGRHPRCQPAPAGALAAAAGQPQVAARPAAGQPGRPRVRAPRPALAEPAAAVRPRRAGAGLNTHPQGVGWVSRAAA